MFQAIVVLVIFYEGFLVSKYVIISIGVSSIIFMLEDIIERIISEVDQVLYSVKF